jgi:hypothetical protein
MERGVGKPSFFDGTNYLYLKIRMLAYLQSIGYNVWEICLDAAFVAESAWITPIEMEFHDSNDKAHNTLFLCLLLSVFKRVGYLATAHQICYTLERFHEGNNHVKTRLFETYRREYKNFVQLARETKSRLEEGVNRRNLKFTNFKHALRPGLVLELNRSTEDSSPCQELLN